MFPVQVPIIDYENPFYCPNSLQFQSLDVSDSAVDLSTSPYSRTSAATFAYNHQGVKNRNFDTDSSSPSIHAFVYGRNRAANDDFRQERVVGRKFARTSYDSSPCARFLASLDEKGPVRKRARYTGSARELDSFWIPDDEWKEPRVVKQKHSSPISLAFPDQDVQIHKVSKERTPEDTVTTRTLLFRLDRVFPGIGFREAADSVQNVWQETNDAQYRSERHQGLIDLLGERGALNEYVLTVVHGAEFSRLDLGPTMRGVNKLNLPLGDIMRVFSQPEWFRHLKTLSFAGGRFRDDFALAHIRPLCRIERLVLANTGIGNEGVFHIVALKHKLQYLDLSGNLSIDDDAIPALILLENLHYLSVARTGVLMPGLRRLAVSVKRGQRDMDVKIPSMCKDYIDGIHKQYLMYPAPPLILDPDVISILSIGALSRNLEAHAAINSSIVFTGPRHEMEERLRKILEIVEFA
ncbi:hypothetical protein OG21DRAFT_1495494 [Imleria badia]|nr:hypothetical protein OG21DRAFT_1495494 [Imleria badia]